jgi:tetratricopeptide repeat protein 21B
MNLVETQALINFYVQKGFNRHVQTLCKDVLKKRGSEPALLFWRAFAIGQEGTHTCFTRVFLPLLRAHSVSTC